MVLVTNALVLRKRHVCLRSRAVVRLVVDRSREADLGENEVRQLAAENFERLNQFGAGITAGVCLEPSSGDGSEQPPGTRRPLGFGDSCWVLSPRVCVVAAPGKREAERQHD